MRKNFSMFFAKLLIFFSILFIIGGVGLLVLGNEFFLHPIYDVSLIENSNSENISITTLDSDEVIEPITESEIIDPSTIINNGSQQNNNLDSNIIQENVEPTIEEVNAQLRMQIQDTYGVTIKYANETNGYSIGGMSTIEINDPDICQAALVNLNNALFMDYYGTLKYTKEGQETVAKVTNKTSSKVKDKVYLEVDKEIQNADNIWIDFYIRGNKIKYILK